MLVVDDVVLFPFKSILMLLREIYNAALQEQEQEAECLRLELSQLYFSLETGVIDEATFDERESHLLDRLDALEAGKTDSDAEDETHAEASWEDDDEEGTEDPDDDVDDEAYEYLLPSETEP